MTKPAAPQRPAGRRTSSASRSEHGDGPAGFGLQARADGRARRLDARRHPADRTRHAGERPERAGSPAWPGRSGSTAAPSMATAAPRASVRSIVERPGTHARSPAVGLRRDQALEEDLVAVSGDRRRRPSGAGGPRAPPRSGSARPRASSCRRARKAATASSSCWPMALVSQAGACTEGETSTSGGSFRGLADDERAGREVAEPLVPLRDEDRGDPDEVRAGEEVDDANDVPHRARRERDRRAGLQHDPQPVRAPCRASVPS